MKNTLDVTRVSLEVYCCCCCCCRCKGKKLPQVVAIDCEMCQTEDPLTGAKDNSALVRLSIVNGLDLDEVATGLAVLDMLVL